MAYNTKDYIYLQTPPRAFPVRKAYSYQHRKVKCLPSGFPMPVHRWEKLMFVMALRVQCGQSLSQILSG